MHSIKRDVLVELKNFLAYLPERGLPGHIDAEVEYRELGNQIFVLVSHHDRSYTFEVKLVERLRMPSV